MTERTFLGWDEPALPQAARRLADAHADGAARLEDALVVLPVGRARRRLRELLLEEGERRPGGLPPPRAVVTPGALPELLYEPENAIAGGALIRRVWAEALQSLPPHVLGPVFPEPPDADDLTGWSRLARVVAGLREDVAAERHDFGDVAGICDSDPELEDGDRWRALARAEELYLDRLDELGFADRHRARRRALEDGRVGVDGSVWLVGVVELTDVAREMLRAVDAPVRALVHAPADLSGAFDGLGTVRSERWVERELELPELTVCGRPPEQADAALSALAGEGPPLAPDEVTVGVPNDEVAPHLSERLEELGVPHRYAPGTGLEETAPYRLLEATAAYLDGRRFADLAALVRHPDLGRRLDVPLEALDRYFEEHLPQRTDALPLSASRREGEMARLLGDLRETLGLGELRGRRRLTEWMDDVVGVLEGVYGDREVDRSRPSDRRLSEACSRIAEAAGSLAELPDGVAPECTAATAVRLLLSEVDELESIPPDPVRPAVEMLEYLELHLDDAPALVLTGMDDDSVPGAAAGDPFLPDRLRSRLGLPDDRSRHGRDAYLLEAGLRPRQESHVVVGRRTADGDPLRPSRLLLAASGRELAERVTRLFGEEPEETVRTVRPRRAEEISEDSGAEDRREPFRSPPEREIRVEEPPGELYVTDFRNLLEDPYRFALERIRGLEPRDDRDRELGPLNFGVLAHRVLHRFADSDAAHSTDPEEIRDRLRELVEEEARRRFGADAFPAVRLQVRHLRVRLRAFAEWQARRARQGWRIAAAEVKPEGEGVEFEVDGETVLLRGRIDRIDRHEERGEWQVLDYKTGESPSSPEDRHRKGRTGEKRWVDLQLPLYRHLLPGIARREDVPGALGRLDPARESPGLGYLHLSSEGVELLLADWTREQLEEADEAARRAVRALREGVFRFRPGEGRSFRDDPLEVLFPEAGRAEEAASGEHPNDADAGDDDEDGGGEGRA